MTMTGFRPHGGTSPQMQELPSTLTITKVYPNGEQEQGSETIMVRRFLTEPAYVRAAAHRTINTGNYENFRIEASVSIPCYVEEAEGALTEASQAVSRYVLREEIGIRQVFGLEQKLPKEIRDSLAGE